MQPLVLLLWLANVVLDTGGQLAFKAAALKEHEGEGWYWLRLMRNPWILIGVTCFICEFVLWLAFLSLVELSEGVLLGSINIVAIMLAGRYLFHEQLTPMRVAGMTLVAIGVAVVSIGT